MHKKICPVGGNTAQKLTFEMSHPPNHPFADLPDAPVQTVRRMDGYGGSGMRYCSPIIRVSNHSFPMLKSYFVAIMSKRLVTREQAMYISEGHYPYESHVTAPVDPSVMKLKPEEACFNTEKYGDAVKALLQNGIIEDTGKRVQIGMYPEKFPISRIHAPQTDNIDEVQRQRKERDEMLASMGFQTMHLGGGGARRS
mmetsp:Transcript_27021/g.42406  ORF Transcript_27021/g.42406 Transcript_27021/m.42406 type:complete len:197 (+) Transcript_27021:276-866(+)|eukprot:CAMPEP_0201741150 /NCGR_PEP_ID=MMETSP0593-20130828/46665_1 /ASSEMBLY_ACC=CAM_ASM_000672 /TAXON_ID=267983 /ORGANISM="Skeletonema japonicum, Strain CCMP2506" /LENGTH=196 /DNA_ID=CAMNT_0048235477 /DNA_START=274 /DNA_END=864 /DNA_ORIENTATION=-